MSDLKIYDPSLDKMRPVTQDDIERLVKCEQAYGNMLGTLRALIPDRLSPVDLHLRWWQRMATAIGEVLLRYAKEEELRRATQAKVDAVEGMK